MVPPYQKLVDGHWPGGQQGFFENFIVNALLIGSARQEKAMLEHNCTVPWAILMDPTFACNLHCTGCWVAEYGNKLNMSYETLDGIKATEIGTFMYMFSGGGPLVRKADIIQLCETHPDCMFVAFTNGALIDEKFAGVYCGSKILFRLSALGALKKPRISAAARELILAVIRAMDILREKNHVFGASCCYTSKNVDFLSSEEYMDHLIEKGTKFA